MKFLIFGDVYGRVGRKALEKELPGLKKKYKPDFTIANVENATSGRGPIEKHVLELKSAGVDIMTSGDHIVDNQEKIKEYISTDESILIRPANFYESKHYALPGKGYKIFEKNGERILIINLLSETFMNFNVYNPFLKLEEILDELKGEKIDSVIVDFHKEVSSEGYGMGYLFDGKIAFVYGTHTHVQTNDEYILDGGTGVITDVGMVGPFPSVIGADHNSLKKRFLTGINRGKIEQSLNDKYVVSGVFVEVKDNKCIQIEKIRIRDSL